MGWGARQKPAWRNQNEGMVRFDIGDKNRRIGTERHQVEKLVSADKGRNTKEHERKRKIWNLMARKLR
jgi:hypothetical protein